MNPGMAFEPPIFNAEAQRVRKNTENSFYLAGYATAFSFLYGPLASPLRLCVEMPFSA